MASCPRQGYLSKSRLLVKGKLSKSGLLLVNGKAACQWQVKGVATCQWLLVQAASQWQAVQGKVTCPSRGCLSRVSCPSQGCCLSMARLHVSGKSKAWPLVSGYLFKLLVNGKLSKARLLGQFTL